MKPLPEGFDRFCSCGEAIRFAVNPLTGNMMPECEHGNHFLDCPDRKRYHRPAPKSPVQVPTLERFGGDTP